MGERGLRWRALDGLRGIAVLMVLADHGGFAGESAAGSAGVTIFFILSGFLITHVILETRARDEWSMRSFLVARAVRLVPALIVMEVVVMAWWLLAGRPWDEVWRQVWAATLYVTNVFPDAGQGGLLSHTWSLATEEQFYLLWPLVLPFVARSRSPLLLVAAAVMASIMARLALAFTGHVGWSYASLASNAFGLLLGGLLVVDHVTVRRGRVQQLVPLLCLAAIGGVVFAAGTAPSAYITVPIVVAPLAAVMVACSLPGVPLLEAAWLRFVGRSSYSLYLWHWPVLVLLDQTYGGVSALLGLALSFVLAAASTVWVEEPLRRRWRRRVAAQAELVQA